MPKLPQNTEISKSRDGLSGALAQHLYRSDQAAIIWIRNGITHNINGLAAQPCTIIFITITFQYQHNKHIRTTRSGGDLQQLALFDQLNEATGKISKRALLQPMTAAVIAAKHSNDHGVYQLY
jgi:hypothetical protein